jgi:hypothetical protein
MGSVRSEEYNFVILGWRRMASIKDQLLEILIDSSWEYREGARDIDHRHSLLEETG